MEAQLAQAVQPGSALRRWALATASLVVPLSIQACLMRSFLPKRPHTKRARRVHVIAARREIFPLSVKLRFKPCANLPLQFLCLALVPLDMLAARPHSLMTVHVPPIMMTMKVMAMTISVCQH